MTRPVAVHQHGRWVVPAGSILATSDHDCRDCGTTVTVLTVLTAAGEELIPNELFEYVTTDGNEPVAVCEACYRADLAHDHAMGWDY